MNRSIQTLIVGTLLALLLLLSGSFFIYGSWSIYKTARFLPTSTRSPGIVARIVLHPQSRAEPPGYSPVIAFVASDGTPHSFESQLRRYPAGFEVGEKVYVLYAPNDPETAKLDTFAELWFEPSLFALLGGIFFSGLAYGSYAEYVKRTPGEH